ncbi:hypothetical protein BH20ACT21_BH20ACT21_14190 [soil metagenome]
MRHGFGPHQWPRRSSRATVAHRPPDSVAHVRRSHIDNQAGRPVAGPGLILARQRAVPLPPTVAEAAGSDRPSDISQCVTPRAYAVDSR